MLGKNWLIWLKDAFDGRRKLRPWDVAATAQITTDAAKDLGRLVAEIGGDRVVLCRCDKPVSLTFGRSLGIKLFQGRHLDSLLAREQASQIDGTRKLNALARKPAPPPASRTRAFGVIGDSH